MKIITAQSIPHASTLARLGEIQDEKKTICKPHYSEFHKMVSEYGFSKITIAKAGR